MSWEMLGFSMKEKCWNCNPISICTQKLIPGGLTTQMQKAKLWNLEDIVEEYIYDFSVRNVFLHETIKKAKPYIKERIEKIDYIKIKNFVHQKNTFLKAKRQTRGLKKIFGK